ncbi:PREDICTED: uncharacterized protein LOC109116279 [Tarenaya hassleriana]|uniref:uncharacterized protein LOC109116279 n=1 Tax=Tarenaya hassleriana TaxID=28532 RepID=UPI0008FD8B58|nr:PREDICTED: uncharacterized protein LOC109116279 [Tarenaya hassleriana]
MMPFLPLASLVDTFDIKDLGELKYFPGIEVSRSDNGLFLSQRKYTLDLLQDTGKIGAKPARTLLETNYKDASDSSPFLDTERFWRVVSQWMHAPTVHTGIWWSVFYVI